MIEHRIGSTVVHTGCAGLTVETDPCLSLAVVAAVSLWGAVAPPASGDRPITLAGVQGGLPNHRYSAALADSAAQRDVVRTYEVLTQRAYARAPDLVVWPETAVRAPVLENADLGRRLLPPDGARSLLVAGLALDDARGVRQNSAVAVAPGGRVVDRYAKVRLVPNHEKHFTPGDAWTPLETPRGRLGVLICLESVYPDAGRAVTAAGAELLLVISNDAGFRRTPIARHMTNRAIVRAVENGRWLLRVGQAGISALVDPAGRVHVELDLFESGLVEGRAFLRDDLTPYTRWGDWWMLVVAGLLAFAAFTAARRSAAAGAGAPDR